MKLLKKLFLIFTAISSFESLIRGAEEEMVNPLVHLIAAGAPMQELLLCKALLYERDPAESYKIYSEIAAEDSTETWHASALMLKGQALLAGVGVAKDPTQAYQCFMECFKKHKNPKALIEVGYYYENQLTMDRNFDLAAGYYKKAFEMGEPMAGFRYARLLYLEKIAHKSENKVQELLSYLRDAIMDLNVYSSTTKSFTDAFFLYAIILLDNELYEEFVPHGLGALHLGAQLGDAACMHQLGILYRNGLFVDKDVKRGDQYLRDALNSENSQANLVTKVYMFMRGDGVQEDRKMAIELLEKAKTGPSNIQDIYDHFAPEIQEFFDDQQLPALQAIPQAVEPDEELSAAKTIDDTKVEDLITTPKKGKQVWRKKIEAAVELKNKQAAQTPVYEVAEVGTTEIKTKTSAQRVQQVRNVLDTLRVMNSSVPSPFPYKTVLEKCNKLSVPVDGSSLEIDTKKTLVRINDPKNKKIFSFPFDELEFHHDVEPQPFKYDGRIKTTAAPKDPHQFGKACDYAIQLFGVLNPYLSQKKKKDDMLIHPANLADVKGHLEYTFYKLKTNYILYHRFFKKIPKFQVPQK